MIGSLPIIGGTWTLSTDWGDVVAIVIGLLIYVLSFVFKKAAEKRKAAQGGEGDVDPLDDELLRELLAEEEREDEQEAWVTAPPPVVTPAPSRSGPPAAFSRLTTARADVRDVARRATRLLERTQGRHDVRFITTALAGRVRPRAEELNDELRALIQRAAEDPSALDSSVVRYERERDRLVAILDYVEQALRERRNDDRGEALGRLDTVLDALFSDAYGTLAWRAGLGRNVKPLTTLNPIPPGAAALVLTVGLLPVSVARTRLRNMADIAALLPAAVTGLLEAHPRLQSEVRHILSQPIQKSEQLAKMLGTPSAVQDTIVPHTGLVFADTVSALFLGPYYFLTLASELAAGDNIHRIFLVSPATALPLPPTTRLWSPATASLALGHDDPEAVKIFDEWRRAVGVGIVETNSGDHIVPLDETSRELYFRTLALLEYRFQALNHATLTSFPALAARKPWREEDTKLVAHLRDTEQLPPLPTGQLVSTALRAGLLSPSLSGDLADALIKAVEHAHRAPLHDPEDEGFTFRPTPQLLADAIVFQAIFDE